jgi:hypothetical protein
MASDDSVTRLQRDQERFYQDLERKEQDFLIEQRRSDSNGAYLWLAEQLSERSVKVNELGRLHGILKRLGLKLRYSEADAKDFADGLMKRLIENKLAEPLPDSDAPPFGSL